MDVAGEVIEHGVGSSNGLGEDDPALVPGDGGQLQVGHGATGEMEEATSKALGEGAHGDEEGRCDPGGDDPPASG